MSEPLGNIRTEVNEKAKILHKKRAIPEQTDITFINKRYTNFQRYFCVEIDFRFPLVIQPTTEKVNSEELRIEHIRIGEYLKILNEMLAAKTDEEMQRILRQIDKK